MAKIVRQIAFKGAEVIIFYTWDRMGSGGNNPSREIRTLSKILSLDHLEQQGAIDLEKLEEML